MILKRALTVHHFNFYVPEDLQTTSGIVRVATACAEYHCCNTHCNMPLHVPTVISMLQYATSCLLIAWWPWPGSGYMILAMM